MKNLFALALIASLLLAGCAGKNAMNDQSIDEVPDVVVEQEAPAAEEAAEPAPAPAPEKVVNRAESKIFFELDSYELNPASKKVLEGNALWLQAQQEVRIVIEGHADERGSDTYNLSLGEKRAQAVRDYLMDLGVAPDRVTIISYGEEKATKGTMSQTVWAQDRRAEIVETN